MLMLKIMSNEDIADHDTRKQFTLVTGIHEVCFRRAGDSSYAMVLKDDGRDELFIPANVYVLDEHGKTVASFGGGRHPNSLDYQSVEVSEDGDAIVEEAA